MSNAELLKAIQYLKTGGVLILPTDTIPGLSGDALSPLVYDRIRTIKQRDLSKNFVILFKNLDQVENYLGKRTQGELKAFRKKTNRPTTYIVENRGMNHTFSNNSKVGVRIPESGIIKEVLLKFDKPIISTSANLSGSESPQTIDNIPDVIKRQVDFVLNLEATSQESQASRIVDLDSSGQEHLIRS